MNIGYVARILRGIEPKLTLWHEAMDGPSMTEGVGGEIIRFGRWTKGAAGGPDAEEFFARIASVPAEPELDFDNAADDIGSIYCTSGPPICPNCSSATCWGIGCSGCPRSISSD